MKQYVTIQLLEEGKIPKDSASAAPERLNSLCATQIDSWLLNKLRYSVAVLYIKAMRKLKKLKNNKRSSLIPQRQA